MKTGSFVFNIYTQHTLYSHKAGSQKDISPSKLAPIVDITCNRDIWKEKKTDNKSLNWNWTEHGTLWYAAKKINGGPVYRPLLTANDCVQPDRYGWNQSTVESRNKNRPRRTASGKSWSTVSNAELTRRTSGVALAYCQLHALYRCRQSKQLFQLSGVDMRTLTGYCRGWSDFCR